MSEDQRGATTKILQQFMRSKNWRVLLLLLQRRSRVLSLARSNFAEVFLNGEGFFLREGGNLQLEEETTVKNLSTSAEVLEAISKHRNHSLLTESEIIHFIIRRTLQKT